MWRDINFFLIHLFFPRPAMRRWNDRFNLRLISFSSLIISDPESRWNIGIIGVNVTMIRLLSLWSRLQTAHLRNGGNINNIFIKSTPGRLGSGHMISAYRNTKAAQETRLFWLTIILRTLFCRYRLLRSNSGAQNANSSSVICLYPARGRALSNQAFG